MAIDTDGEKYSIINAGTPWYVCGPVLDGAFSQGEFQHLLHMFVGVLIQSIDHYRVKLLAYFENASLPAYFENVSLESHAANVTVTADSEDL